jgi:hypothetical protein
MFDAYDELDYWDDYLVRSFRGQPLPKNWQMPRYEIGAPDKPLHDFVHGESAAPFISKRAKQVLEAVTRGDVQFWPIGKVQDRDYFIMNVVRVVDCLDLEKSDILTASDGRVLSLRSAVFHPDKLSDCPVIFKVPQDTGVIFVNDLFVNCVRGHRLTGVGFEYPNNVGVSAPHNAFSDLPLRK